MHLGTRCIGWPPNACSWTYSPFQLSAESASSAGRSPVAVLQEAERALEMQDSEALALFNALEIRGNGGRYRKAFFGRARENNYWHGSKRRTKFKLQTGFGSHRSHPEIAETHHSTATGLSRSAAPSCRPMSPARPQPAAPPHLKPAQPAPGQIAAEVRSTSRPHSDAGPGTTPPHADDRARARPSPPAQDQPDKPSNHP